MAYFDQEPTSLTGDGSDGFPVETDFDIQMEDYLQGLNPKKRAKALMTQDMYSTILSVLLEPQSTAFSTAQFRFWAKRMFRLVSTAHANIVAHENRPVAVKDQIYNILVGCHGDAAHGGRDKTSAQVRRYYSWIPKELVSRFVKMCPMCIAKRKSQKPYFGDSLLPAASIARVAVSASSSNEYAARRAAKAAMSLHGYGMHSQQQQQQQQQAMYPLANRSQTRDSFENLGVEGVELDYNVYELPHNQDVYDYGAYEAQEDEQSRPYTGYSDSSGLSVPEPHSPLHLAPGSYYEQDPQMLEHDYSTVVAQEQLHFYTEENYAMEPVHDYSHDLAVWEATEQATGGGGSFALDPPLPFGLTGPLLEMQPQTATYDETWETAMPIDPSYDPTGQVLHHHEPASFVVPDDTPQHLHSRRAVKPPPLDLSALYSPSGLISSYDPHADRRCSTGVPSYHLSQPREPIGPYSAPLDNPFAHQLPSPVLPSPAFSTYSLNSATSSSSNGLSMPLTPGSSYSGGMEHLHLAHNSGGGDDWQQSSKELAFAIQNLIDATHLKSGEQAENEHAEEGIRVDDGERIDRQRTRTRTVSASGFLVPSSSPPSSVERRGSATYGAFEQDVLQRTPRKEERFSPYQRA